MSRFDRLTQVRHLFVRKDIRAFAESRRRRKRRTQPSPPADSPPDAGSDISGPS